jgi:hypothetical protein
MLIEISCEKFQEKKISFHEGLNVILGDENGANSIGKSTLLMVIEFAFGGSDFLELHPDVVKELGHHTYHFSFRFGDELFRFARSTSAPTIIQRCDSSFRKLEDISLAKFNEFLGEKYSITKDNMSFRAAVGLFSRIWGKDNLTTSRPLHTVQNQKAADSINNLIRLYERYSEVRELVAALDEKTQQRNVLKKALGKNLIPKIGRSQFVENQGAIESIRGEVDDIKENLAKYATNLSQIVNKEILELKVEKDRLLTARARLAEKLVRIRRDLEGARHLKSKHLKSLIDFFPDVDLKRIEEIETFHSKISSLLKHEIQSAERGLVIQLEAIDKEVKSLDDKMAATLSSVNNPAAIVDRVYNLSARYQKLQQENKYYLENKELGEDVQDLTTKLHELKGSVLRSIEEIINKNLIEIVEKIYGGTRRSPKLFLSDTNYKFEVVEDTGTGKAYSNLLVLDMAIFKTTKLPFLIHDSILYKNIENPAIAKFVELYDHLGKQSFIAIDEAGKYGKVAEAILLRRAVVQLQNDKVLYIKDWRDSSSLKH